MGHVMCHSINEVSYHKWAVILSKQISVKENFQYFNQKNYHKIKFKNFILLSAHSWLWSLLLMMMVC